MQVSPRTIDFQSSLATHAAFGGNQPWSTEVPRSGPVLQGAATMCAAKDEEIVAQGDKADHRYLIVGGCVRTVRLMQDGRRQVGGFLLPGDMFRWDSLTVDRWGSGLPKVHTLA